ncbi:hypothetical protein QT971_07830 [Microcoleus sp. herbarium19]
MFLLWQAVPSASWEDKADNKIFENLGKSGKSAILGDREDKEVSQQLNC